MLCVCVCVCVWLCVCLRISTRSATELGLSIWVHSTTTPTEVTAGRRRQIEHTYCMWVVECVVGSVVNRFPSSVHECRRVACISSMITGSRLFVCENWRVMAKLHRGDFVVEWGLLGNLSLHHRHYKIHRNEIHKKTTKSLKVRHI